ncbi:Ig-like domain-containing protein [candidate division KSB1 bacterium]|nr:Ig-like domain-containing protein [bacterium]NUM66374.1 Ig-like domain-containing protein [candidate division KSB1 bacterium]
MPSAAQNCAIVKRNRFALRQPGNAGRRRRNWAVLGAALVGLTCAKTGSPPGGPVDDIPPKILSTSPARDATGVARDTQLSFTFSEKVNRKSFEESLFITPSLGGELEEEAELKFDWQGRTVHIRFPDSLRARRTYVVNLGTDVRDLRGVRLLEAFALAFTTGDTLDRGEIRGRIWGEKAAGVLIMAYILENGRAPDPAKQRADYYTQVGENNTFTLSYLAPGRYRVFALSDRNADRLYTRGEEAIGVPALDVTITREDQTAPSLSFSLAAEDTLAPALAAVSPLSANQLEWRFDEAVMPLHGDWRARLRVTAKESQTPLALLAAFPHPLNRNQVLALSAPLQAVAYLAAADSLFDEAGNCIDSARSQIEFEGLTQPDTLRPRLIKISIADSSRDLPLDLPIELVFSEIMRRDSLARALLVRDSSGAAVSGNAGWVNPLQYRFAPAAGWQSRARYEFVIAADSLFDWNGNALLDTTGRVTFWTLNADTLASISGALSDARDSTAGDMHLQAKQLGGKIEYHVLARAPGNYTFPAVLPGLYQLSGFRDGNRNGRFDAGTAFPFVPAERAHVWPDTVKVRSRWPNEGNDLVLP